MLKLKNKLAGERLLSFYLFIVYIIVTVGIVSGVILFYGSSFDVRSFEAKVLNDKAIGCISKQGHLAEGFDAGFDIEGKCNFDFSEEYGVKIEFLGTGEAVKAGNPDFFELCRLKGNKLPKCFEREIYVLSKNKDKEEGVFLRITSAVGKISKNTK